MAFLNVPLKSIQCVLGNVIGTETMAWYNPAGFPVRPPNPPPAPIQLYYRWRVNLLIARQNHSAYNTREPGVYNGQDVTVGQWIANLTTGQAWQIIEIPSKTQFLVTAIIQDVYRYNTFRDSSGAGNGAPNTGVYVIFNVGETGLPELDPVPPSGVSSTFGINLQSRFQYINLQHDYPLYQENNNFAVNDVIAANAQSHTFVLSDDVNRVVVGRITSISDTKPGWFTINPVQKVVDFLDFLPGGVGDIIYSSVEDPGELTLEPGGTEIYVKLRDNTSSVTVSRTAGPTTTGNIFQLNGIDITVAAIGDAVALINSVNFHQAETGVVASSVLTPTSVETNVSLITPVYGEPALYAASTPATATLNGVPLVFNITSTDPGYEEYARAAQMAMVINNAAIPNIIAETPNILTLLITNTAGGPITIVNGVFDTNNIPFAGTASGSGLVLNTPASTNSRVKFTAVDARTINFLDVVGTTIADFGLTSVENGIKAAGLYIEEGLRQATTTVVMNLASLNTLHPLVGDQAYVIDSNDGLGNNVGEWSLWIYNGATWILTSSQNSSTTDAKSLEYGLRVSSPPLINIGEISTGRRVTLITIHVTTPFNGTPTLNIGYQVNNPSLPPAVPNGLMDSTFIDLTVAGTYATSTDILFGIDTQQGDVTITGSFVLDGATEGAAQVIVSYV